MIKLYGHFDSGHVYKVMLFLEIGRIDYEYIHVDIWTAKQQRQAVFLKASRNGEVPAIDMDGDCLIQSNLILHKLASTFQMFGGESKQRLLQALEWQFWEANRLGMCLPQLRYARRFAADEFTPGSLAFLKARFDQDIQHLAHHLDSGRKFILDDQPSIADFSLCGYLYWAHEAKVELPKPVQHWLQRIRELDRYKAPYEMMQRFRYA